MCDSFVCRGPRRLVASLACAGLLVLLLVGGGSAAPAPVAVGAENADLALVPADAQGFLAVRMADLWKVDAVRSMTWLIGDKSTPKVDPVAEMRKALGLVPADVERVTYVVTDAKNDGMWVVVSTVKPYNRAALLEKVKNARVVVHEGRSYTIGKMGEGTTDTAVYFVDPRVVVYAPEAGMKSCLSFLKGPKKRGPLDVGLKLAKAKRHLVAGINPPAEAMRQLRESVGGGLKGAASVFEFKTVTFTIDADETTRFDLTANYPDARKAREARIAIDGGKAAGELLLLPMLDDQLKMVLPAAQAKGIGDAIRRMLESFKAEAKGADVEISFRFDHKVLGALAPARK